MLLAIDAGNTRTKWGLFDARGEMLKKGVCANAAFSAALLPDQVSCTFISNVAGSVHAERLQTVLTECHLKPEWLQSTSECCNVFNGYERPETLGTDRWASMIAAWRMQNKSCIVVNAGTAITIDALIPKDNPRQAEFAGGIIMPGLALMQNSLGTATAQLPKKLNREVATQEADGIFAKSTAQAISAGALCAACGAIEKMAAHLAQKKGIMPSIILSGGDAPVIQKHLSNHWENQLVLVDNLVLSGLYLVHQTQQNLA